MAFGKGGMKGGFKEAEPKMKAPKEGKMGGGKSGGFGGFKMGSRVGWAASDWKSDTGHPLHRRVSPDP
jgi:hypothetical protein